MDTSGTAGSECESSKDVELPASAGDLRFSRSSRSSEDLEPLPGSQDSNARPVHEIVSGMW